MHFMLQTKHNLDNMLISFFILKNIQMVLFSTNYIYNFPPSPTNSALHSQHVKCVFSINIFVMKLVDGGIMA